jgi:RNA-directed DNA polymerase
MAHIPFGQIRTVAGLAANLGCSVSDLEELSTGTDQRQFYTRLEIPKKGRRRGQFRIVHRPDQRLGLIQKNVGRWITQLTDFDACVQGFVPRRSIATNARAHLGARLILHADIQDFFDAIKIVQVLDAFRKLGCAEPIAEVLARICTLNGQLPQGSSSSPPLANLVCRRLDADLLVLARAHQCQYSRYADDITISGDSVPAAADVSAILREHGFVLRKDKCRVQRRGRTQYVTGLTVSDRTRPRVPRVQKRRLRLILHYAARFGVADHLQRTRSEVDVSTELARLEGWLNFLHSVEGQGRLSEQWRTVAAREQEIAALQAQSQQETDS